MSSAIPEMPHQNGFPPYEGSRIFGAGEMVERTRNHDWGATPVGSMSTWSEILFTSVNLLLASRFPTIILWGPDLNVFYNDAYLPLMGDKHPAALGQSARQCWKEAWHILGPQVDSVLLGGGTVYEENVLVPVQRKAHVQDVYWTYSYNPIYSPSGEVDGVFIVCHDVTGEVLAKNELRESEARATRVLQSIGDAVIVTDVDTRILRMNPVAEQLTGWKEKEAQARPLAEVLHIVHETTRQIVESPADKVTRTGAIVGLANHTVLIGRNGTEVQIDDSGAPIRDEKGNLTGIVLVFRNVAERRAAEREREQLAEQLKQVLEATKDAVVTVDRDWITTYMNPKATEMYGMGREITGQNIWHSFPEVAYEGSPFTEHCYRAMDRGTPSSFEAHYPEPLNITLGVEVYPTRNGIVIFSRDVTELKRATAALLQNEKLAAVGRLAASIAHEINNPLESVTNLLYLARTSTDFSEVQSYLDTAERELRRVSVISNQTLRFYKQSSSPVSVTCEDLINGALDIYQGRIVNSRIHVEKRKRAHRPVLCFDGEIRQVLNNLIGNAIDAMHPGGGRLLIRSREGTKWKTGQQGLVLTIADTGSGMSPAVLRKIFVPFYTTKGIGGTGLGLWVSQEIIHRHRGSLQVRSCHREDRSGTVFTIFLPFEAVTR